jgi:YD repeat-containing protein
MRQIRWEGPVEVASPTEDAWQFALSSASTHLADMDGDGLADLVHKATDGSVFYFANCGQSAWGPRQPMAAEFFAPPAPFGTPDVRTADVDFDKRMDLIRGDGLFYQIWFNFGANQYSERITVGADNGFDFSVPGVEIADMNGDRVPDIARLRPASIEVTAGLGYGRFAQLISISIPDGPLEAAQADRARLSDINGDGLGDLVLERPEPGTLWYWLNLGNYSLSGRKVIRGMPSGVGQGSALRWADLNGNGSTDLVYADSMALPRLCTVDMGELLNRGGAPNSLVAISNGLGRVTLIHYEPSTKFALADAAAGQPWPDPVPLPVSVVAAVTNGDSLGNWYVTLCRYHNGYYDGAQKQFRGFARAEQVDLGDETVPTLVTEHYFHTGRDHDALKGKLLRLITRQENGQVFWDETTAWTSPPRSLLTGTNGTNVVYAHPVARSKIIRELGQGAEKRVLVELAYDDYGNEITNANYGIVEGSDRSIGNDERISVTQYAINPDRWLLRFPSSQEIRDEHGAVFSRTRWFYDDETFSGANSGAVRIGDTTLRQEWVNPGSAAAHVAAARTRYDQYGNPTVLLDPLGLAPGGQVDFSFGHARQLAYDEHFHTHPISETVHVGSNTAPLVFQATYDPGLDVVLTSSDYNSNLTVYGSDSLGRLTQILRPGDQPQFPSEKYAYALAQPAGSNGLVNYVETLCLDRVPDSAGERNRDHYLISRQFSDGLGRSLMKKKEAEPVPESVTPRVVVLEAVVFNARKTSRHILNPYFTTLGGDLDSMLAYEPIQSPGWSGWFQTGEDVSALSLPEAHRVEQTCDATLRQISNRFPDGSERRAVYGPLQITFYDESDRDASSASADTPVIHYRDGLGRLIRIEQVTRLTVDGLPGQALQTWTTECIYDVNDRLLRITDAQNNLRQFEYDGLKRRTLMHDAV